MSKSGNQFFLTTNNRGIKKNYQLKFSVKYKKAIF